MHFDLDLALVFVTASALGASLLIAIAKRALTPR